MTTLQEMSGTMVDKQGAIGRRCGAPVRARTKRKFVENADSKHH